jgi:hypothetical protein
MPDLLLTRSNELDVAHVRGVTGAGVEFVDRWVQDEMTVYDVGVIIIRYGADMLEREALAEGLTVEHYLISSERPGGGLV